MGSGITEIKLQVFPYALWTDTAQSTCRRKATNREKRGLHKQKNNNIISLQ